MGNELQIAKNKENLIKVKKGKKKMSKNLRFCYKVDKRVGLAEDEFGNPGEAFVCAKAKNVKKYILSQEDYKKMQDEFRKIVADQLRCNEDLLAPITINEYLDRTETEI